MTPDGTKSSAVPEVEVHSRSSDAIVIGESIIDIVTTDGRSRERPGGSPANVAVGLARLGRTVGFLTRIGPDRHGRRIRSHLERSGVALLRGSADTRPTSTARAALGPNGAARYDFDVVWDLPGGVDIPNAAIIHTGSIGAFTAPGANTVFRLLQDHVSTALITLDANTRPALMGPPADARARFEQLIPLCGLVKLSDEDASWLYPRTTIDTIIDRIHQAGVRVIAVTLGADGAILTGADTQVHIPAPHAVVADTIGAGDSYTSALLHCLLPHVTRTTTSTVINLDEDSLNAAGTFAAAAAAITVSRTGADPPRLDEMSVQG